jgi:hypothetical protein
MRWESAPSAWPLRVGDKGHPLVVGATDDRRCPLAVEPPNEPDAGPWQEVIAAGSRERHLRCPGPLFELAGTEFGGLAHDDCHLLLVQRTAVRVTQLDVMVSRSERELLFFVTLWSAGRRDVKASRQSRVEIGWKSVAFWSIGAKRHFQA